LRRLRLNPAVDYGSRHLAGEALDCCNTFRRDITDHGLARPLLHAVDNHRTSPAEPGAAAKLHADELFLVAQRPQ
jgi:hypothetical protein